MYYTAPRTARRVLDGTAGLWCVNLGHRPQAHRRCRRPASSMTAGLRADVPDGPPHRLRVRRAARRHRAGRAGRQARPRVLHQLRLGIGRHGAEDRRSPTSASIGQGTRTPAHRARARLPRRRLRRPVGRRHRQQPARLPDPARRSTTCATPTTSARNAFVHGQPEHGAELADDLERLVALHGAETIAARSSSSPCRPGRPACSLPPRGYLERTPGDAATGTASCSSSTKWSPASAVSARPSPPTSSA